MYFYDSLRKAISLIVKYETVISIIVLNAGMKQSSLLNEKKDTFEKKKRTRRCTKRNEIIECFIQCKKILLSQTE